MFGTLERSSRSVEKPYGSDWYTEKQAKPKQQQKV